MVLPTLLLGLGGFGRRGNEQSGHATHVPCMGEISSILRAVNFSRWRASEIHIGRPMGDD